MGKKLELLLDNVTDIAGIISLTILGVHGTASPELVGGIVSVALGQRYVKSKIGKRATDE